MTATWIQYCVGSLWRKYVPQFDDAMPEQSATNRQAAKYAPTKPMEMEVPIPCLRNQNDTALAVTGTSNARNQRSECHSRK